jgi:two-component system, response regulator YesN
MPYKVVFVEDEIVTREGIRDNVDWRANGYEFCGEAPDGEMALPLLQTTAPDVLITDIKMPFMDGLQLCKIVRQRMPWIKIVILSGHDEFEYAQQAIKLGVTEYLLKPVTVHDLNNVLQRVAAQLDKDRKDQADLEKLKDQVNENRAVLQERLLLKLVVGAVSLAEAIEKSAPLGMDLVARYYLVVVLKVELADRSEQFDYDEYERVQRLVGNLVGRNPDVFLLRKDWQELLLIIKGDTPEYLEEERDILVDVMKREVHQTKYRLVIGIGTPKNRITDIYQSFVEALVSLQTSVDENRHGPNGAIDKTELLRVDRTAVEDYLRSGVREDFDRFFDAFMRPVGDSAFRSYLIKDYIFVDVVLAAAKFVNELNGDIDQLIPELNTIETVLADIITVEQLREQVRKILLGALTFRDGERSGQYTGMILQARKYIEHHYMDPDLSLNQVAVQVNLSPSHFSVVFGQETGTTFKEYLTEVRIKRAKELLRMTPMRATEITYQVGYSDPHYFSHVFRKQTGLSPTEFRLRAQAG